MTEDHGRQADAAERELADMEQRSQRVSEHIDEARKNWEAKVADGTVPVAGDEPDDEEHDGELPPPDPHETD